MEDKKYIKEQFQIGRYLRTEFYLSLFLILILFFLRIFADGFYSINNMMSILNRFSYVLIAAVGMNIIIITSNIDVSAGAIISVICITLASIGKLGAPLPILLPLAVVLGGLVSMLNALFITKLKIPSIVATLATTQLMSGILPLMFEGSIYDLPASFTYLAFEAKVFGIFPVSVIMMFVIVVIAMVFMEYSKFSKSLYAVGNNKEGARLAGINVDRVIVTAYIISGCLMGVSATIIATASQRVTTTMGSGLEMTFIAAVVLGGTSISGGRGKIIGTVIAALILSLIAPATNYIGISSDWSDAIMGAVIIASVVISAIKIKRRRKKTFEGV